MGYQNETQQLYGVWTSLIELYSSTWNERAQIKQLEAKGDREHYLDKTRQLAAMLNRKLVESGLNVRLVKDTLDPSDLKRLLADQLGKFKLEGMFTVSQAETV